MKIKWSKILTDPSFWLLLGVNAYLVYQYEQTPEIFSTLIWLYLSQSFLLGFFNFLDMITSRKVDVLSYRTEENSWKSDKEIANGASWFFLMHYSFFHVGYLIFVAVMKKSGSFDWAFYKWFLLVFFVFQLFNFIQHKIQNQNRPANISRMFALPYLRIVPMHLCILIPAFLSISNLTVFLVLKVITDLIMYVITSDHYKKGVLTDKAGIVNMGSDMIN